MEEKYNAGLMQGAYPHTTKLTESFSHNIRRLEGSLYNVDRKIDDVNISLAKLRVDHDEAQKKEKTCYFERAKLKKEAAKINKSTFKFVHGVAWSLLYCFRRMEGSAEDLRVTVDRSDLVVFYVEHEYGGTWKTMKYAVNQKKKIINLVTK